MIKDGKYLEDRSVALIKLEVDVPTTEFLTGAFVRKTGRHTETIDGTKIFTDPVELNCVTQGLNAVTVNGRAAFNSNVNMSGAVNISGAVTMSGSVTMTGSVTQVNSTNLAIKDNEIIINDGESGTGITHSSGMSGVRIDRGGLADYLIGFRESDDKFVAGLDNGTPLRQVAFVDDIDTSDPVLTGDVVVDGAYPNLKLKAIQGKNLTIPTGYAGVESGCVMYYDGNTWFPYKVSDILPPADIGEGSGCVAIGESKSSAGGGFAGAAEPLIYRQITFSPALAEGTDYTVLIVPSENTQAKVGEFWWEKADAPTSTQSSFRVYNTGDSGVSFRWAVFAVGMPVGVAQGDLSGNYNSSNLKVVGLRGVALADNVAVPAVGDVMTFTNGKWTASPPVGGSGAVTTSTPAGGDVTGVYPSLKVSGILSKPILDVNNQPVSVFPEGSTIRYNGTNWVLGVHQLNGDVTGAQDFTKVVKIQNRKISAVQPSDRQALAWDAAAEEWTPTTMGTKLPGTDGDGGTPEDDWWDEDIPDLIADPWYVDPATPATLDAISPSSTVFINPLDKNNPNGFMFYTFENGTINMRIVADPMISSSFSSYIISNMASGPSACNPHTGTFFTVAADGEIQRRNVASPGLVAGSPYISGITGVDPYSLSSYGTYEWCGPISNLRRPVFAGRFQGSDIWVAQSPVSATSANSDIKVSYDDGANFITALSNVATKVNLSVKFSSLDHNTPYYTWSPAYVAGVSMSSSGSPLVFFGFPGKYARFPITSGTPAPGSFADKLLNYRLYSALYVYDVFSNTVTTVRSSLFPPGASYGRRLYPVATLGIYTGVMKACGIENNNKKYSIDRTLMSTPLTDTYCNLAWGKFGAGNFQVESMVQSASNLTRSYDTSDNPLGTSDAVYSNDMDTLILHSPWRADSDSIQLITGNGSSINIIKASDGASTVLIPGSDDLVYAMPSLNRKRIAIVAKISGVNVIRVFRSSY